MNIWNLQTGDVVRQTDMALLYNELNGDTMGLYSYIAGGFEITYDENNSNKLIISPGTAKAVMNPNSQLVSQVINPIARITDSFKGVNDINPPPPGTPVSIITQSGTSGYIILSIYLSGSSNPSDNSELTTYNVISSSYDPIPVLAPTPTSANNYLIGQVLLYKYTNSGGIVTTSVLGPTRKATINNISNITVDYNLREYFNPKTYLLSCELVTSGPSSNFPVSGLYVFPTDSLPSYSSFLLGEPSDSGGVGQVFEYKVGKVITGSGNIDNLAFLQINSSVISNYPQFNSTGIYLVSASAQIKDAGIFISDTSPYSFNIPNPFSSSYIANNSDSTFASVSNYSTIVNNIYAPGILICNSSALSGYHGLFMCVDGFIYDVIL